MPDLLTEITEIVTGLGMLGHDSVDAALAARPVTLKNVTADHWARLEAARAHGLHTDAFDAAWANGRLFLASADGLRGRLPALVRERTTATSRVRSHPADLRSTTSTCECKYQSKILSEARLRTLRIAGSRTERPRRRCPGSRLRFDADEHFYSA